MFGDISSQFSSLFNKLRGRAILTDKDIIKHIQTVRNLLLDSDTSLEIADQICDSIRSKATTIKIKGSSADKLMLKLVYDEIFSLLSLGHTEIKYQSSNNKIMMIGLQGVGKTTTAAKLGRLLQKTGKKVALVPLDLKRYAATNQLNQLSNDIGADFISPQDSNINTAKYAMTMLDNYDYMIFDTAGRLNVDEEALNELKEIDSIVNPNHSIIVVDSMSGRDAVNVINLFREAININGSILTRIDGQSKCGAALALTYKKDLPIYYITNGEKIENILPFEPESVTKSIVGIADIQGLSQHVNSMLGEENINEHANKMMSGKLTLDDFRAQLKTFLKIGGMKGIGQFMGNMGNMSLNDKTIKKQIAIISSMTPKEKRHYKIIDSSRRIRIAKGAGVQVSDVNQILKQYEQLNMFTKQLSKNRGSPTEMLSKIKSMFKK